MGKAVLGATDLAVRSPISIGRKIALFSCRFEALRHTIETFVEAQTNQNHPCPTCKNSRNRERLNGTDYRSPPIVPPLGIGVE